MTTTQKNMNIPSSIELKELASIRHKIDGLTARAARIMGVSQNGSNGTSPPERVRKPMSQSTRNKIRAAQKRRWKKIKANEK